MVEKFPDEKEKNFKNPLTCIHDAYTLAYTPECSNAAEEVTVKHFLNTLAEVALSIAARKIKDIEEGK